MFPACALFPFPPFASRHCSHGVFVGVALAFIAVGIDFGVAVIGGSDIEIHFPLATTTLSTFLAGVDVGGFSVLDGLGILVGGIGRSVGSAIIGRVTTTGGRVGVDVFTTTAVDLGIAVIFTP